MLRAGSPPHWMVKEGGEGGREGRREEREGRGKEREGRREESDERRGKEGEGISLALLFNTQRMWT